jgi:hypothetical protein
LPSYWEHLVAKFGNKSGLGNCFGDSDAVDDDGGDTDEEEQGSLEADSEGEVEGDEADTLSAEEGKKRKQQEIESQRSKRQKAQTPTKEMALSDGLHSIANALVEATKASNAPVNAPIPEEVNLSLLAITKSLENQTEATNKMIIEQSSTNARMMEAQESICSILKFIAEKL